MGINAIPYINAPVSLEEALSNRAIRDILASKPHPNEFRASRGFTYLDYALWCKQSYQWYAKKHLLSAITKMVEGARQTELREAIVRG